MSCIDGWTIPGRQHLNTSNCDNNGPVAGALLAFAERPFMAMCGRPRFGKVCFKGCAIWSGAAMCPACLCDTRIAGPNAIRGSGPNYFHELRGSLAKTGCPEPRCSTGLALPHIHPAKLVVSCASGAAHRRPTIGLAANQHGPSGSRILVGQGDGGHLGGFALHEISQPRVVGKPCLASLPDH